MGYTTAELIIAVRDEFGEDTASTSAVSDDQILKFLNQAQREMCFKSNVLLSCASTASIANQEEYPIPDDYLRMASVYVFRDQGIKRYLKPIQMQERDPTETASTDQRAYYIWGINVNGVNKYYMGLQYIPESTSAVDDIFLFYRQAPTTMTIGGGTVAPEVPFHLQDGLINGALARVYNRFASTDTKWLSLMDRKVKMWQDWMVEAKRFVNPLTLDQPIQIRDTSFYTQDQRIY